MQTLKNRMPLLHVLVPISPMATKCLFNLHTLLLLENTVYSLKKRYVTQRDVFVFASFASELELPETRRASNYLTGAQLLFLLVNFTC